jgi:hypothetical protein
MAGKKRPFKMLVPAVENYYYNSKFEVLKDIHYSNPVKKRSVVLRRGAILGLDHAPIYGGEFKAFSLYGEVTRNNNHVWECLGNTHPVAETLEDLVEFSIGTLLEHPTA